MMRKLIDRKLHKIDEWMENRNPVHLFIVHKNVKFPIILSQKKKIIPKSCLFVVVQNVFRCCN